MKLSLNISSWRKKEVAASAAVAQTDLLSSVPSSAAPGRVPSSPADVILLLWTMPLSDLHPWES